jgi:hypothetical protein
LLKFYLPKMSHGASWIISILILYVGFGSNLKISAEIFLKVNGITYTTANCQLLTAKHLLPTVYCLLITVFRVLTSTANLDI